MERACLLVLIGSRAWEGLVIIEGTLKDVRMYAWAQFTQSITSSCITIMAAKRGQGVQKEVIIKLLFCASRETWTIHSTLPKEALP